MRKASKKMVLAVAIKMDPNKLHREYLVRKPVIFGVIGGLVLFGLYFLILTLANSFQHAIQEFTRLWYWISLLIIGFGIQVGLYMYVRGFVKVKNRIGATGSIAATGGVSTGSMAACCVHHLSDVLPFLGLSAAVVFLNKYQIVFIIIGVLSNIVGISWMFRIIQKHHLYQSDKGFFRKLMQFNMKRSFYYTLGSSVLVLFIVILLEV